MGKTTFLFFCSFLAVSVVVEGFVNNHDLIEYRLAPKRYHRKVRSKLPEVSPITKPKEDFSFELPLLNITADEAASPSSANSSFLLDLPYPSHFLFSLQLLNLSLPFIGDGVQVPEDPPIPTVDIQDVLNNTQYFRPDNRRTPSEDKPLDRPSSDGRRSVNRFRNRIPAHLRHLPKRSVEESDANGKSPSQWNASSSIRRRQEFHAKLRATTTSKPGLTKKLLFRRANSTGKLNKLKAQIESRSSSLKPITRGAPEQEQSAQTHQFDFTRPSLIIDAQTRRTKMSGFIFTDEQSKPVFTVKPTQVSSGFVPLIPISPQRNHFTTTTTEPSFFSPQQTSHSTTKFSRFEYPAKNNNDNNNQPLSASESTQIQKPETFTVKTLTGEDIVSASTSLPTTDVVLNFTFPSFELPNPDGSKGPPPTLPPPLSIEELIKKFTGSDPITDPPTVNPLPTDQFLKSSPGRALSQFTNLTFTPEVSPIENIDVTLKGLIAATGSKNEFDISTQAPEFKFPQIPSPNKEAVTTDPSVFLSQFILPIADEKNHSETSTKPAPSENPALIFAVPLNLSDSSLANTTVLPKNQTLSVQRGPLDVSSLDIGGGLASSVSQGSFHQGGYQQPTTFNFQSGGFQQHQPQTGGNDFGGFQHQHGFQQQGFQQQLGPADIAAGQQNPFYYATAGGFPGASAGQGQLLQPSGFDGLLHYGPTGPPAGEYNAITQGLSLLASFGGGGGQQFAIQHPAPFQQGQSFGDFSSSTSLQSASQLQPTVNLPTQGFYNQGFPSFNLVQQPQASYQLATSQQVPYQIGQQAQSYQAPPQQFQQQVYSPQQLQQQLPSGSPTAGFPTQLFQIQPHGTVFQSTGQSAQTGSAQLSINPAQFGTLLSGATSSASETGAASTGTALVTSLTSSTSSGNTARSDKASSPSQIVEVQLKPDTEKAVVDSVPAASEVVEIIAIGSESLSSERKSASKKSYFKRGLQSGYYS